MGYELQTERLCLREFRQGDLDDLLALYSDPIVQRYEWGVQERMETQHFLNKILFLQDLDPPQHIGWMITRRGEEETMGCVVLEFTWQFKDEWEVGWALRQEFWGQGIATEAARAVLALAFQRFGAQRVIARCQVENTASLRVMEKLGMQWEARLPKARHRPEGVFDDTVYAITETEFAAGATA